MKQKPDLIVVSGNVWGIIPQEIVMDISRMIREGAGLVIFQPEPEFFGSIGSFDPVECKDFSPSGFKKINFLAGTKIRKWLSGTGCLLSVNFPEEMRVSSFLPLSESTYPGLFEVSAAYVLSIFKLATSIPNPVMLREIDVPRAMNWSMESPGRVKLVLESKISSEVMICLSIADEDSFAIESEIEKKAGLAAGENVVNLDIPPLISGCKICAVRVEMEGGIISHGAGELEIETGVSLGVCPKSDIFDAGEPITFDFKATGWDSGDVLEFRCCDYWGRIVAVIEKFAVCTEGTLVFPRIPATRSRTVHIEAVIYRRGQVVMKSRREIFLKMPVEPGGFHLFGWSGPQHSVNPMSINYAMHLKACGIDTAFFLTRTGGCWGNKDTRRYPQMAARLNMNLFTGVTYRENRQHIGSRMLSELCDDNFIEEDRRGLWEKVGESEEYGGCLGYSYGDELYVRPWVKEHIAVNKEPVKSKFIDYLREKYGNEIKELNATWGTDFSDFESLLIPEDIDIPCEPRAPWLDYCSFISFAATGFYNSLADYVSERYPGVSVGFEGLEQFSCYDGIDLYQYQKKHDVLIMYTHIDHDNKIYSWKSIVDFKKPGSFGGIWLAYDSDLVPEIASTFPWRSLFFGLNSVAYFQIFNFSDKYAAFYPDYRPRPAFDAVSRECLRIQNGIDKLISGSQRRHCPIAIHYSPRSFALSFPESGITNHINRLGSYDVYNTFRDNYLGSTPTAASAFIMLMQDSGYQTKMIATEQIESGELDGFKVLFLPFSQSLTVLEIQEIKRFVADGGFLIADYACGIRDEDGNLNPDGGGVLDELFGIKQGKHYGAEQAVVVSGMIGVEDYPSILASSRMEDVVVGGHLEIINQAEDFAVSSGGSGKSEGNRIRQTFMASEGNPRAFGSARDKTPVFICHPYGKGDTLYLNFALDSYLNMRRQGKAASMRTLIADTVNVIGGIPAPVQVLRSESGLYSGKAFINMPEDHVETTFFSDGAAEYAGIVWDFKTPDWSRRKIRVIFDSPSHVYDVMDGRYLGFTDSINSEANPCSVKLYAKMPYMVDSLQVTSEAESASPGMPFKFHLLIITAQGEKPERHIVKIDVHDPEMKKVEGCSGSVEVSGESEDYLWNPAFNDTAGEYTFVFTDVVSGICRNMKVPLENSISKFG
ncbi:MAG: beta-galactosidase trimerization domain-containing protein [Victivallales bacterium]|nr:beta-galactosidase trimerization domain-containing protein [Victivallales bacterium]